MKSREEEALKEKLKRVYRTFNGKKYTLYCSGTKKRVEDYVKRYGIPKNALYRVVVVSGEYRLYMYFKK